MVLLIDNSINIKPTFIIGDNLMVQNQVILSDQGNRELSNDGVAIKTALKAKSTRVWDGILPFGLSTLTRKSGSQQKVSL